jgi:transcriptional regulator with XRE-family HTH domain
MTVADRIKDLRVKQGLSQDDLAKKMGFKNRSSVTQVEKSGNDITLRKVEKYARALCVSPAYLMGWEEPSYDIVVTRADGTEELIEISKGLSDEGYEKLLSYARFLNSQTDSES